MTFGFVELICAVCSITLYLGWLESHQRPKKWRFLDEINGPPPKSSRMGAYLVGSAWFAGLGLLGSLGVIT